MNSSLVTLGVLPTELAPRLNTGGGHHALGPTSRSPNARRAQLRVGLSKSSFTSKGETYVGHESVGSVIHLDNGSKIDHMGDTPLFADMRFIGDSSKPDLVLIPIGATDLVADLGAAGMWAAVRRHLVRRIAAP